jgi:DNA-binding IclR family transcriptional regulator
LQSRVIRTVSGASLQSLERGLRLLFALAEQTRPRTLQELSQLVGSSQSTVHRTLATLAEFGLVERDPQTRRYRLGLGALRLADARGQQVELQGIAPPYVEWLRDRSQETVSVSVLVGRDAVDVIRAESPLELRQTVRIGQRIPLADLGARARVLLAFLPAPTAEAILDSVRWEERPTTRRQVTAELAGIRERGTARSFGERTGSAAAIAAPIRDRQGQVVAALLVSGPLSRFTAEAMDRIEPDLRQAAGELERQLGFPAPSST